MNDDLLGQRQGRRRAAKLCRVSEAGGSGDTAREREETAAAIREGLADAAAGRVKPARTALSGLAKKYGVLAPDA